MRLPWQVEDDEQGHNRDGDVSHVDLLGVPVGPPLMKEHDPLANSHVQNHQDRDRSQSRRDKWVKLSKRMKQSCIHGRQTLFPH